MRDVEQKQAAQVRRAVCEASGALKARAVGNVHEGDELVRALTDDG